jgi:poly-gamma-glutamate synthesis protein (capsule biosynthesis protein)
LKHLLLTLGAGVAVLALLAIPSRTHLEPVPTRSPLLHPEVKILFVGDMFFDRSIRQYQERYGEAYPFSCLGELFSRADFVVGNLEGPITPHESVSVGSVVGSPENFTFTFATATAALLHAQGVGVVDLGNNHILNFGLEGIISTRKYLDEAGVSYFGGVGGDEPVARVDRDGIPLSFVSYNQFGGVGASRVAEKIAAEKAQGRTVIVFAHWGEEYTDTSAELRPVAELFAQSGANIIFGMHQHIVLPSEVIGATPVYYGLGNFIFDQYFEPAVTKGLSVLVTFSAQGSMSTQEFPVVMTPDRRTCPATM